jgi:hypothetical protein
MKCMADETHITNEYWFLHRCKRTFKVQKVITDTVKVKVKVIVQQDTMSSSIDSSLMDFLRKIIHFPDTRFYLNKVEYHDRKFFEECLLEGIDVLYDPVDQNVYGTIVQQTSISFSGYCDKIGDFKGEAVVGVDQYEDCCYHRIVINTTTI